MQIKNSIWGVITKIFGPFNAIRYIEFDIINRWLSSKKDDFILDIACGSGELSRMISASGAKVIGLDISKKSIEKFMILNRKNANLIVASAENLPFKSKVFNKIVCNTSLQLIPNDMAALNEMSRVLKDNGIAILTVDSLIHPMLDGKLKKIHKTKNKVYRYYTIKNIKEKAKLAKMSIMNFKYYMHSPIAAVLFNFGIILNWSLIWRILSLLLYPVLKMWENRYAGYWQYGYGLAVKLRKVRHHNEKRIDNCRQ